MFFSVLSSVDWTTQYRTVGEQVFLGITMSLVGMTLVFLILVLISTVVSVMSLVISKRTSKMVENAAPGQTVRPVQASVPAALQTSPDPAIVAAITAAISAILAAEGQPSSTAGFRIRQIRRV